MIVLRVFGAAAIVVAAFILLVPSVQRGIVDNLAQARIRAGYRRRLPLQRTALSLLSLMMIFYALTVVL
jgi:hypothetical protein